MSLYADMVAACSQKEAAGSTHTVQNGRKSQTYCQYNGVFQIALFEGNLDEGDP